MILFDQSDPATMVESLQYYNVRSVMKKLHESSYLPDKQLCSRDERGTLLQQGKCDRNLWQLYEQCRCELRALFCQ